MPDITMCANKHCPINRTCYRYTAKPKEFHQSYAMFGAERITNDVICDNFIDNKSRLK